jgi:hypothetical protein
VLAGFDIVLPPSAGDEIVAGAYLERLRQCSDRIAVACACPRVRETLGGDGGRYTCVSVASPPVAAARYLRAEHGNNVLITFVGDCPGASDPAIDARFSPLGFLASLHRQGIVIGDLPDTDRHRIAWARHLSTPGGLPARRFLARPPVDRVVREVASVSIAHETPSPRSRIVVDVVGVKCSCSAGREALADIEPPRSATPLFDVPRGLDVGTGHSAGRSRASLRARDGLTTDSPPAAPAPPTARLLPAQSAAATAAPVDLPAAARIEAQPAPRASGTPVPPLRAASPRDLSTARGAGRSPWLLVLPFAVLGGATALGVAAYATSSRGANPVSVDSTRAAHIDSGESASRTDTLGRGTRAVPDSRTIPGGAPASPHADSLRIDSVRADSNRARRPRRARPAEVMPGWLPQGQPTWTPDSQAGRRPDTTPPKPTDDRRPNER